MFGYAYHQSKWRGQQKYLKTANTAAENYENTANTVDNNEEARFMVAFGKQTFATEERTLLREEHKPLWTQQSITALLQTSIGFPISRSHSMKNPGSGWGHSVQFACSPCGWLGFLQVLILHILKTNW